MSLSEIKSAIKQLSFEQRAELAAWLHGWKDDQWDDQMKRDIASGKLDDVLREIEEDIKTGRVREMPGGQSGVRANYRHSGARVATDFHLRVSLDCQANQHEPRYALFDSYAVRE